MAEIFLILFLFVFLKKREEEDEKEEEEEIFAKTADFRLYTSGAPRELAWCDFAARRERRDLRRFRAH